MHPLFICCRHAEMTFEVAHIDECCQHTIGFRKAKRLPKRLKDKAPEIAMALRSVHESTKHFELTGKNLCPICSKEMKQYGKHSYGCDCFPKARLSIG